MQEIALPASKSLSNRALILKALCSTPCNLAHLSKCDDTRVMMNAFAHPDCDTIDIGAAGTSMRFLTAYLATQENRETIITGSERMRHRPIGTLVNALRHLGADISYIEKEGYPPLRICGKHLQGGDLPIEGSISSQYISALLMIAPTLENGLNLKLCGDIISTPYIRMTLGLMKHWGVDSEWLGDCIRIKHQIYEGCDYAIESDWSAASYWYEIMAITDLPSIKLLGLKQESWQGDSYIAKYFEVLGIKTHYESDGVLLTRKGELPTNVNWDLSSQPDLAQTLITTCCALGITFDICGLQTLRIKETDRIAALKTELKKLGYVLSDYDDCRMIWEGRRCPKEEHPIIATYEDHRMAMAFAPLSATQENRSLHIENPLVVSKSYPTFWKDLDQIGFSIEHNTSE